MILHTKRANFAIILYAWLVTFMALGANILADMPFSQLLIVIGIAALLSILPTIMHILNGPVLLTKWLAICGITIYCYYNLYASTGTGSFRALYLFFEAIILVALYLNEVIVLAYATGIEIINNLLYIISYDHFYHPLDNTTIFQFHVAFIGCTILLYFLTRWGREMLKRSEERWQFALEGNGDGVWDWNIQTGEVFFSKQWKSMLGYTDDDIENHICEWESRLHPEDKEKVYKEIDKHLRGEIPYYFAEHRFKCKDGSYKWILDRGKVIIRTKDGKPLRMVCSHTDIDELKKIQEALREERDRAQALQLQLIQKEKIEALGHLTAGVAHEINSPLGVIKSNIEITNIVFNYLKEKVYNHVPVKEIEKVKSMIQKLNKANEVNIMACERINEIVKQLYKFSRVDQAEWQIFSIEEGVENVLNLIYNHEYSQRIIIHKDYKPIPAIYCNPGQINQVFMNIIHNRFQAIEQNGEVYFRTFADDKYAYLVIRDTGKVISKEQQSRIFNPGFKINDVVEMELGLTISYNIIQNHHGDILIKSEEGKGTEFIIKLPVFNVLQKTSA